MSKLVHLFYPIDDEEYTKDLLFEGIDAKLKYNHKSSYFSTIVIIEFMNDSVVGEPQFGRGCRKPKYKHLEEIPPDMLSEDEAWELLDLADDSVEDKRLLTDIDTCRQRAVLNYFTPADARAAVLKYHRTEEYRTLCAVVAGDVIANIEAWEEEIKGSDTIKEQEQIVKFSKVKGDIAKEFQKNIVDTMSFVSPEFAVRVLYDPKASGIREALLKFPYLSQALAAELAFNGTVVGEDDVLSVRMVRNPVLVQHDIKERAVAVRPPAEPEKRGKSLLIKYISLRDKFRFPEVGCLNFECEMCGNRSLNPRK